MLSLSEDRTSRIARALSGRHSLADLADILDRYVSQCPARCSCMEARAALQRMHKHNANFYVRAALRTLDANEQACSSMRKVIQALRKFGRVALR